MGLSLPVLSPGSVGQAANQLPQNVVLSAVDAVANPQYPQGTILLLTSDVDCWFAFGQAAVVHGSGAAQGSTYLPGKALPFLVKVPAQANNTYPGQGTTGTAGQVALHAIAAGAGNLCITPMINN